MDEYKSKLDSKQDFDEDDSSRNNFNNYNDQKKSSNTPHGSASTKTSDDNAKTSASKDYSSEQVDAVKKLVIFLKPKMKPRFN
jgi:hypothetical protein